MCFKTRIKIVQFKVACLFQFLFFFSFSVINWCIASYYVFGATYRRFIALKPAIAFHKFMANNGTSSRNMALWMNVTERTRARGRQRERTVNSIIFCCAHGENVLHSFPFHNGFQWFRHLNENVTSNRKPNTLITDKNVAFIFTLIQFTTRTNDTIGTAGQSGTNVQLFFVGWIVIRQTVYFFL